MSIWFSERYLTAEELRASGILQEANRQFFHPLGLALQVDLGTDAIRIRDGREDPEGWIFGDGIMTAENCRRFEDFAIPRCIARMKRFGYITQPPPADRMSALMADFEKALAALKPPADSEPAEKMYTPPSMKPVEG